MVGITSQGRLKWLNCSRIIKWSLSWNLSANDRHVSFRIYVYARNQKFIAPLAILFVVLIAYQWYICFIDMTTKIIWSVNSVTKYARSTLV